MWWYVMVQWGFTEDLKNGCVRVKHPLNAWRIFHQCMGNIQKMTCCWNQPCCCHFRIVKPMGFPFKKAVAVLILNAFLLESLTLLLNRSHHIMIIPSRFWGIIGNPKLLLLSLNKEPWISIMKLLDHGSPGLKILPPSRGWTVSNQNFF